MIPKVKVGNVSYIKTQHGMWRQEKIETFDYSSSYLQQQSTNLEMSYLRLGYLLSTVPYPRLRHAKVLELGPGTGTFFNIMGKHVKEMHGFDVAKSAFTTMSMEETKKQRWDLLCAFDVIEHFHDIDDLWTYDFEYGYFSSPRLPSQGLFKKWRHLKPNEHLTHFNETHFRDWVEANDAVVLKEGCPEDMLRTRWDDDQVNIASYIIRRNNVKKTEE